MTRRTQTSVAPEHDSDGGLHTHRRAVWLGAVRFGAIINEAVLADHQFASNSEISVLLALRLQGPRRARELAELTGMTRAGTTNLIDRLQRAGVVERTPVVSDRRGIRVELTTRGFRTVDAIIDSATAAYVGLSDSLAAWREHFIAMGIDVGEQWIPSTLPKRRHEEFQRLTSFGSVVTPLYDSTFGPDAVRPHQLLHLLLLATESDGTRPLEIGEQLRMSSASVSDLLARAERDGLVVRTSGTAPDRRARIVTATPNGHRILDSLIDRSDDAIEALAERFFVS